MASILISSRIHLLDCNDSLRHAENEDEGFEKVLSDKE